MEETEPLTAQFHPQLPQCADSFEAGNFSTPVDICQTEISPNTCFFA